VRLDCGPSAGPSRNAPPALFRSPYPHSRLTDERNLSPILETSREDESLDHSKLSCAPAIDDVGTEELPRLDTTDPCSDRNIALYVYVMQCRPAPCMRQSALTVVAGP
jgi:hypothetical protein